MIRVSLRTVEAERKVYLRLFVQRQLYERTPLHTKMHLSLESYVHRSLEIIVRRTRMLSMSRNLLSTCLGLIRPFMLGGEASVVSCSTRGSLKSLSERSYASSLTTNDRPFAPTVNLSNLRDNGNATKKVGGTTVT